MTLAILDHGYQAIADVLGVSVNSIRTIAQRISGKCGSPGLGEIAWRFRTNLRESGAR